MCRRMTCLVFISLLLTIGLNTIARAELVGWWKMDETSGTTVPDSSGNGIDGILQGAAAIVNDAERGLVFQQNDATANYISIADPAGLLNFSATGPHQGSATTMAWVKSNGNWTSHDVIFNQGEWDDGIGLSIKADTSPAGQLWLAGDGTHAVTFRSDVAVPTNSWHHVAATFAYNGTATVVTLYIDGKPTGFSQGDGRIPGRVSAPVGGASRIGLENRNGTSPRWPFNGSIDDVAVFDTALSGAEVQAAMQRIGGQQGAASNPIPADGAEDVMRDIALSWKAGPFSGTHNVYLGTSFADVNAAGTTSPLNVLASAGQDANTYDPPGVLVLGQTYYWRIDEVNASADHTVFRGDVWSFTVEPVSYPIENITATASSSAANQGPERTIDGSGLNAGDLHGTTDTTMWQTNGSMPAWIQYDFNDVYKLQEMWVWNSNQSIEPFAGMGAKNVVVQYSVDGVTWTALAGVQPFARAPGAAGYAHNTTVNFGGVAARYVKLTISSNWGGLVPQVGLSEVRFFYIPVQAREPQPAAAATGVTPSIVLNWRAGREAVSHQVYFGADANALPLAGTVADSTFTPAAVNLGTTYYWRVDEVNAAETPSLWTGTVWSFTTSAYVTVDDLESYNDSTNAVFNTWLDGYNAPTTNGALVGNDAAAGGTFCETTIVHGGRQAMPIRYNNATPSVSEAERTWETPQNWAVHGANTLSLWFRGQPVGFVELASDHILMNGQGADIYNTADQGRFVYKQLTGNGTLIARVDRLDAVDPWSKAGVMIRQTLDAGSIWAMSLYAPGNGCRFQTRPTTGGNGTTDTAVATAAQIAIRAPVWIKLERVGNVFTASYATVEAPTTWIASPVGPQTIVMTDPVYIGLACTSHQAATATQAEFSAIATTGNVTGAWQSVDLGTVAQPAGNTLDTFYVTVKDSAGKSATIKHSDPAAVTAGTYQQWQIPLSSLTPVDATRVKSMIIGVGDKTNPKRGAGKLYIDDIQYGRPAN